MNSERDEKLNILVMPKPGGSFFSVAVSPRLLYILAIAAAVVIALNAWLLAGYVSMKHRAARGVAAPAVAAPRQEPATGQDRANARIDDLQDNSRALMREMRGLRDESEKLDNKLKNLIDEKNIKELPTEDKYTSPRGSMEPDLGEIEKMLASMKQAVDARWNFVILAEYRASNIAERLSRVPEISPVATTRLTSPEGMRIHPISGLPEFHKGVDLGGWMGAGIYATGAGVIKKAGMNGGYGIEVIIDHENGFETRYGHLEESMVVPGRRVQRGDIIGFMGSTGYSTGPHLHYELYYKGKLLNPEPFMKLDPGGLI